MDRNFHGRMRLSDNDVETIAKFSKTERGKELQRLSDTKKKEESMKVKTVIRGGKMKMKVES